MEIGLVGRRAGATTESRTSTSPTSRRRPTGCGRRASRSGIVLELTGEMRLLDVYDPDGNRIQLAEELRD